MGDISGPKELHVYVSAELRLAERHVLTLRQHRWNPMRSLLHHYPALHVWQETSALVV
jgi:hypothetical protein